MRILFSLTISIGLLTAFTRCSSTRLEKTLLMDSHSRILIDDDPITVLEYKEFVYNQSNEEKEGLLPSGIGIPGYYSNPENLDKPVIGLSADQARMYCIWRSEVWNNKGLPYKFEFRLPTQKELIQASEIDNANLKGEFVIEQGLTKVLDLETGRIGDPDNSEDTGLVGFRCIVQVD